MSERWWRKRRKKRPVFNDSFDEFDRVEEMTNKTMRRTFGTASERAKIRRHYFYGFSLSIGPDGKSVIRGFETVQPSQVGPKIQKEREPLVDVIEEDEAIVVIAELPGVEKHDIRLHATEENLTVSVDTTNQKFCRKLALPARVDPESAGASYKNGVLGVRLKKLEAAVEDQRTSVK